MEIQKPAGGMDPWHSLRTHTPARIALGRTGVSLPLQQQLYLKVAHAMARDAVHAQLNKELLFAGLAKTGLAFGFFSSGAADREHYLLRPDLGRKLSAESRSELERIHFNGADIQVIIADGLAADAVHSHALPVIEHLISLAGENNLSLAPIAVVEQGRVAVADEIGQLCGARITVILIGERPGLSAADSLGAYITFAPMPGRSDAERSCISNIRPAGLAYSTAAKQIVELCTAALKEGYTGVSSGNRLKEK